MRDLRRSLALMLALTALSLLFFGGCTKPPSDSSSTVSSWYASSLASFDSSFDSSSDTLPEPSSEVFSLPDSSKAVSSAPPSKFVSNRGSELRAVWISYLELNYKGKSKADFERDAAARMENLKSLNINAAIVHVRAHSDAYYASKLFPYAKNLTGTQGQAPGYDPLQILIREAHSRGIELHAWFNPFRVGGANDTIASLADSNPAKKWRTDTDPGNDSRVIDLKADLGDPNGGIYYNPGVLEVRRLILDGVREVLDNYEVDGIHFDDYFYPTVSPEFDRKEYEAYTKTVSQPMELADWRRYQVNQLVTGIYAMTKEYKKEFGISPAANIEHNRNNLYADIEYWVKSGSYVDYICPQIYFGFEYPQKQYQFVSLCTRWEQLVKNTNVTLYIGLGPYKIGETDPKDSSAPGSDEWIVKTDILKRQVEHIRGLSRYGGFMLFSYSYLFPAENAKNRDKMISQRENLKAVLS